LLLQVQRYIWRNHDATSESCEISLFEFNRSQVLTLLECSHINYLVIEFEDLANVESKKVYN